MNVYSELQSFIEKAKNESVPEDRQNLLKPLIEYVQSVYNQQGHVNLNFVCTHNSRRSQLSQVWAKVFAELHDIKVNAFSGGVEVTACHQNTVESLKRAGLRVNKLEAGDNPRYEVSYAQDEAPLVLFSKKVENEVNPTQDFAAIMTCDHANETCPFIAGASRRIPITYQDPKQFDGTQKESAAYDERSLQIAAEMNFVFSNIS